MQIRTTTTVRLNRLECLRLAPPEEVQDLFGSESSIELELDPTSVHLLVAQAPSIFDHLNLRIPVIGQSYDGLEFSFTYQKLLPWGRVQGSSLRNCVFRSIRFVDTDFIDSDLTEAKFEGCDFLRCTFGLKSMDGVNFYSSSFKDCTFFSSGTARISDTVSTSGPRFVSSNLGNSTPPQGARLEKCSLSNVGEFSMVEMRSCTIFDTPYLRVYDCDCFDVHVRANSTDHMFFSSSVLNQVDIYYDRVPTHTGQPCIVWGGNVRARRVTMEVTREAGTRVRLSPNPPRARRARPVTAASPEPTTSILENRGIDLEF